MNEDIRPHVAQQETLQGAPGGEQDEQDQQEFSHLPAISGERSLLSGIPTALACFIRLPPDASTSAETAAMHFVCAQLNQSTQSFPWMTPEGFETTTAATDPVWLGFLDSLDPTRVRRRPTNGTKTLETRMQGHPHGLSATPEYLAALRRHKTAPGNNDVSTIDSSSGITIPGPHSRNRPQLPTPVPPPPFRSWQGRPNSYANMRISGRPSALDVNRDSAARLPPIGNFRSVSGSSSASSRRQ